MIDILRPLTLSVVLVFGAARMARAEGLAGQTLYQRDVQPVLNEYCYDCHADGTEKGNLALDKHPDYAGLLGDRKLWTAVLEHVSTHVMPPDGKAAPTQQQRDMIVNWIEDAVFAVDPNKPDPGHITLRRLNRAEYNNTVRDIFKLQTRPADNFPPDDTGYGFDNIGDVLSLSPILMEKYLRAARNIVESSVWSRSDDRILIQKSGEEFKAADGSSKGQEGVRWFYSNAGAETWIQTPWEAIFRMNMQLSANQCGAEKPKFSVLLDGKEIHSGEVTEEFDPGAPNDHWQRFAWDQRIPKGGHKLTVRYLNDFANPADPNPRRRDRNLALESLQIEGPLAFRSPKSSPYVAELFDYKPFLPPLLDLDGDDFDSGEGMNTFTEGEAFMATNGFIHRTVDVPADGRYRMTVKALPDQAGSEFVKVGFKFGAQNLGMREVKGKTKEPQWVTLEFDMKRGPQDLQIAFLNDFYEKAKGQDRNVGIAQVILYGPLPANERLDDAVWQTLIQKMGVRIYRHPIEPDEARRFTALIAQLRQQGNSPVEIISALTEAMLCSPKFLFRGGAGGSGPVERGTVLIDEYSLASRLSYFLWSSCPDAELYRLASQGQLRKNLEPQIRRMIADWKGAAMTENFAGQWLMLRDVSLASPDPKRFPTFNGRIAADMKKESQMYFEHILKDNRSVIEFLDSDYTFLNGRLAVFYGIPGVAGKEFRQVSLAGTPRGGILTQGSLLTITSHPTRTSPVKRGKFVLEQILGTPPPPPPQNVPPLAEGHRGHKLAGTLRQRMEQHRSNKSCAACHAFLDPMGFAFEHFDAIGRWRDTDNGEKIDASAQLITGEKFDGVEQLRKVLATDKKEQFLKSLTENLMTYALGRGLTYTDKPFRQEIVRRAEQDGYKFQDLIVGVCESIPFQRIKAEEAGAVAGK